MNLLGSFWIFTLTSRGAAIPDDCPICLDGLGNEAKPETVTDCNHIFHTACLGEWLAQNDSCPYCRGSLSDHEWAANLKRLMVSWDKRCFLILFVGQCYIFQFKPTPQPVFTTIYFPCQSEYCECSEVYGEFYDNLGDSVAVMTREMIRGDPCEALYDFYHVTFRSIGEIAWVFEPNYLILFGTYATGVLCNSLAASAHFHWRSLVNRVWLPQRLRNLHEMILGGAVSLQDRYRPQIEAAEEFLSEEELLRFPTEFETVGLLVLAFGQDRPAASRRLRLATESVSLLGVMFGVRSVIRCLVSPESRLASARLVSAVLFINQASFNLIMLVTAVLRSQRLECFAGSLSNSICIAVVSAAVLRSLKQSETAVLY